MLAWWYIYHRKFPIFPLNSEGKCPQLHREPPDEALADGDTFYQEVRTDRARRARRGRRPAGLLATRA